MELSPIWKDTFLQILREELIPAMGCTEPIAIAYGAARAREVLGCLPEEVLVEASGNIIKNVKSVIVPNTNGLSGIEAAVAGNRTGDIGHAVQSYAESFGFSVVRELEGHGLGKEMHEAPGVPNYGRQGHGCRLVDGMVICIEPMINAGGRGVYVARNGWAVHTSDHRNAAHYELTVVVRKGKAEQLSTFDYIESTGKF